MIVKVFNGLIMHRFPNPGSDIKNSIDSLRFIMENIKDDEYFDLYDMKELLVVNGFISSSGATGMQALNKSDNLDRSRDQTYNQCKMYAEIYRSLGWISSVNKALDYQVSLFGRHVLNSKINPKLIFEYCLLGIENPNDILKISRQYRLRPFLAILNFAHKLGGSISRDEMIFGPLFLKDDTDKHEIDEVCQEIIKYRKLKGELSKMLAKKYEERMAETGLSFSATTAGNYTRFPIAAIQWVNWFSKEKNSFHLTEYGFKALNHAKSKYDLRFDDIDNNELLVNASKFAYYQFLLDYGYDLGALSQEYENSRANLPDKMTVNGMLFSPFSVVGSDKLAKIFKFTKPIQKRETNIETSESAHAYSYAKIATPFRLIENSSNPENEYSNQLKALLESNVDEDVIRIIKNEVRLYRKDGLPRIL